MVSYVDEYYVIPCTLSISNVLNISRSLRNRRERVYLIFSIPDDRNALKIDLGDDPVTSLSREGGLSFKSLLL